MLKGKPVALDAALDAARRLIAAAKHPVALVSSWGSNEELAAFAGALGGRFTRVRQAGPGARARRTGRGRPPHPRGQEPEHDGGPQAVRQMLAPAFDAETDLVLVWGEGFDFSRLPAKREDHLPQCLAAAGERARRRLLPDQRPDRARAGTTRTSRARSAPSSPASRRSRGSSTPRRCSPRWPQHRGAGHDPGPRRLRRLHRLRARGADEVRHDPDVGRAQAGRGHVRPDRRQPRLHPHPVHAVQDDLAGAVPRHRRRPQDAAEGGLEAELVRPVCVRRRAVGGVHARAAGVRRHPVRRRAGSGEALRGVSRRVRVVRRQNLSDADRPARRGAADRVRVRRDVDHRRDARRLVVVEQVLDAGRGARRLADDLLRADHGAHGAGTDPHLRHGRPHDDRPAAIRHAAGVPARRGGSFSSRSPRRCSSRPRSPRTSASRSTCRRRSRSSSPASTPSTAR